MIVREGLAEIEVEEARIPEERRRSGFFNPEMRENRDIAVASLKVFGKGKVLDAFSATGIRAIRFCKEAGWQAEAAEVNEEAFKRMAANIRRNSCEIRAWKMDCRKVMMENIYDAIDIDPYGSPAQFIYPAFLGLKKRSLLMVTATDTANLFGVYPRKAFRLYGIRVWKGFSAKEMGVRALATFIIKTGAMLGKGFRPLLMYSYKHYVRIIGEVRRSKAEANRMLDMLKEYRGEMYYMGPLKDREFLEGLMRELEGDNYSEDSLNLVLKISQELDEPFYYDTHDYGCPSLEKVREAIEKEGGKFSRTHFSPTSFKTDLPKDRVEEILAHLP